MNQLLTHVDDRPRPLVLLFSDVGVWHDDDRATYRAEYQMVANMIFNRPAMKTTGEGEKKTFESLI